MCRHIFARGRFKVIYRPEIRVTLYVAPKVKWAGICQKLECLLEARLGAAPFSVQVPKLRTFKCSADSPRKTTALVFMLIIQDKRREIHATLRFPDTWPT